MAGKLSKAVATIIVAAALACIVPVVAGQARFLSVMSGSMSPAISAGDLILVAGADPASVREGDIISFMKGDEIVTHRVVGVAGNPAGSGEAAFRTKGDANEDADLETVGSSALVGKFLFCIPFAGYAVGFARTLPGLAMLVFLPGSLIIAAEIRKILKSSGKLE